jgi:hypothetical protein
MLEGLALLIFIYTLTVSLPAFGKLRNMLDIRRNSKTAIGLLAQANSTRNLLASPLDGIAYRSVIRYQPEKGPALELFFRDHNLLMSKRYSLGDSVEVIYDAAAPYRAYPIADWKAALRDMWLSVSACC